MECSAARIRATAAKGISPPAIEQQDAGLVRLSRFLRGQPWFQGSVEGGGEGGGCVSVDRLRQSIATRLGRGEQQRDDQLVLERQPIL